MKVSIIIPAYNEEKRIGKTLEEYCKFFKKLKDKKALDFEILVVMNNTKDKTEDVVKEYSKTYPEIRYLNLVHGGKGYAVKEGFSDALMRDNQLIGFVDADLATSAESFYDLIKNINEYDGIIASRWMKTSVIKIKQTFLRRILSFGFNLIVRTLFLIPFKDTQCGAKLFKKEVIKKINPELNITQWAFDVNLLYLATRNNFKIKEQPTIWEDKTDSKLNVMKVPFQMFSGVVRLRLLNSPFYGIVNMYDRLPEKIKIHHRF